MQGNIAILCLPLSLMMLSCQTDKANEQTVATAYGQHLQIETLGGQLTTARTSRDSQRIIDKEVDNWIMDEILVHEAKKKFSADEDIKEKVSSYEKSLYIHELEKYHIESQLDTTISKAEMDTFYIRNQEEYLNTEALIQGLMIKVSDNRYNDTIKNLWKTEDLPALKVVLSENEGNFHLLDVAKWYQESRLKNLLPDGLWKRINFKEKESYSYSDNGNQYLVKILGHTPEGDPMPTSYAAPLIKSRIIRDRSRALLQRWRKDVFQNNIQSKDIIIYSQTKLSNN